MIMDPGCLKNKLENIKNIQALQNQHKKIKQVVNKKGTTSQSTKENSSNGKKVKKDDKNKKKSSKKVNKTTKVKKEVIIDSGNSGTRKWEDYKDNDNIKKGQFTQEESEKVIAAICEYAEDKGLSESDVINLVTEKQSKENSIWPTIAECLPNRSVQSVHNFCHRVLNPYNYKGAWTGEEERELIE
jgi:hypothetical protein